jgi:hypothetical protein
MERTETDADTPLGTLLLKVLGVDIQNEEDCKRLRNGLEMLLSPQMQEHCRNAAVEHKKTHRRMNQTEAEQIVKMLQVGAVFTICACIRRPYETWFRFGGYVTVASRSAKRTRMVEEDKRDEDDIICCVNTMIKVAKREKRSGGKVEIKSRARKMSAPSNRTQGRSLHTTESYGII